MFEASRNDGQPLVMGILNVTPDSFSDGGRFVDLKAACSYAERMVIEGANIIDVGGESTRPGAEAIAPRVQLERVLPVINQLRAQLPATIALSIDTRNVEVAQRALRAGANIVNDVSAGQDASMLATVAAHGAGIVLMHMQGSPATMQDDPRYLDVAAEVCAFLFARAQAAEAAGVARTNIALDPGIGFGKTRVHNLRLLATLEELVAYGYAVLLGTSRKRFMGVICDETNPLELVGATCATTALGVAAGARIFRVHDVKANRQAADVAWAIEAVRQPGAR